MKGAKGSYKNLNKEIEKKVKFFYENFFSGFALNKIITNDKGEAIDFEFISVNSVFEILTGRKRETLIGQKGSAIFSSFTNSKFNWLDVVSTIAFHNSKAKFSFFAEKAQKWFSVVIFSPQLGYFIVLLDDITKIKKSEIQLNRKQDELEQLNIAFRNQNKELADRNEILASLNEEHLKVIKELKNSFEKTEQIHNQLFESETTARAIIDAASDIIVLLDSDGSVIDCNESFLRGLKVSKEMVTGGKIFNFFPPEIAKSRKEAFEKVIATGLKEVVRDIGEEGFYETTVSPYLDQNNNVTKVVIIARNISDRFNAQKQLFESEKKYRLLAENSEDIIWTFDITTMSLSYISPAISKLLGYSTDEVIDITGKSKLPIFNLDFYNEIKEKVEIFKSGDKSNTVSIHQNELPCKDGSLKPVETITKLILDENGEIKEILGVTRDISKRRVIEDQLKKALEKAEESDRLKSAFLANMSHEIRTPMNGIIGFADLLNTPNLDPEKLSRYAEIININGKHLLSIINDIIDISKIEAGQVLVNESSVDINSLFNELETFFSSVKFRNPNVKIFSNSKLQSNDSLIFTDEVKLKQILTNLISNALKFTENGSVEFSCRIVQQEGKPFLLFTVKDTGVGISKANQNVIFERFRQVDFTTERKYGGTGLGLPISKAYVEIQGGRIWVDSNIGKGSKFYFTLPFKRVNITGGEDQSGSENILSEINWSDKTIMIAEDEDINYFFLSEILNLTKAKLIRAVNGIEAIQLCKQNELIDIVLMDIKMPGLNGYEATRKIKSMRPDLPVIAQTALAFSDDLQKALDAGCDDYITKPIIKEYLIEKLNRFFDNTFE